MHASLKAMEEFKIWRQKEVQIELDSFGGRFKNVISAKFPFQAAASGQRVPVERIHFETVQNQILEQRHFSQHVFRSEMDKSES